jgi:hypothetical protein
MNPFEKFLTSSREIPIVAASSYLLELRDFGKTAEAVTKPEDDLRRVLRKELSITDFRKAHPTAFIQKQAAREAPSDDELRETGRQRGVTAIAAEHEREKSRRGERAGKAMGTLGGAAAGGALGRHLVGGPAGTLGGAALGGLLGRGMGGELGTEFDIARAPRPAPAVLKEAAARMAAWVKQAQGDVGADVGSQEAPMASPTDTQTPMPQNYLQAEAIGQEAQNANEANYFREKARASEAASAQVTQQAQQQVEQVQASAAALQAEADSAAQRIQASLQEAMRARDEALQQTEIAANLRMAMQKQRQVMMEVASQDPAADSAAALQSSMPPVPPAEPPMEGQQMVSEGPAGQSPAPNTPPGAAPPAGAKDMNAPAGPPPGSPPEAAAPAGGVPPVGTKEGHVKQAFIGAVTGAGLGLITGAGSVAYDQSRNVAEMQSRLSELQRTQDGSYGQAAAAARLQKQIVDTQMAQNFPGHIAAQRSISTAMNFGMRGAGIESAIRRLAR